MSHSECFSFPPKHSVETYWPHLRHASLNQNKAKIEICIIRNRNDKYLCDDYQETNMHVLWLCEQAQSVLKSEDSFCLLYQKQYRSFMDLFEAVLDGGLIFHVAWFSTIAWGLWQRRNRLREKQAAWPLHEVSKRAKDSVMEFFDIHKKRSSCSFLQGQFWCCLHWKWWGC